ncbi:hypothetical protein HB665_24225 [Bacillus paranthracis]|uniref:hypothetical protein n=1 Tax=Bacillus cereus group TaxID=86661 RepID=UPI001443F905|nr:hypothetical protein [Bacillus paranthracis]NKX27234.1 hypothetical protein [Bacillus paranthracis]
MRSLGKSMGEPLLTKYLQATSNKEQISTSPIDNVSLVKNEHEKLKSIRSLTREINKSNK